MEKLITFAVPCYNSAAYMQRCIDTLLTAGEEAEIIIVNDGSTDDTRKICARRHFNFMDLPVNTGLSGAIKSGMRYANYYGYDYVLQLDGDGQHEHEPPESFELDPILIDHEGEDDAEEVVGEGGADGPDEGPDDGP